LASWIERKGIIDLVQAVEELFQSDAKVTLTLAGTRLNAECIQPDFAPSIRGRIAVVPTITGTGALIDLNRRHDVFVLPSYFEGQALEWREGGALGLVRVVSEIEGNRDFVQHGVNDSWLTLVRLKHSHVSCPTYCHIPNCQSN